MLGAGTTLLLFVSLVLFGKMASPHAVAAAVSTSASAARKASGPAALIFMHGLGDTPSGWSFLESYLRGTKTRLGEIRCVFPPAPVIGITINGGQEMPGWFDIYDWPIGITARDDSEGILRAVAQIDKQVELLERDHGIPKNRVVVGGFSQGGAIALLSAYHNHHRGDSDQDEDDKAEKRRRTPFAGCVALSGWLTLEEDLKVPKETAETTPLFWGHGKYDDKVLFEQQAYGVDILRQQGVMVTAKNYPVAHRSDETELEDLANFLDRVLFGNEQDS